MKRHQQNISLQVQRGYAVLEELEDALTSSGRNRAALLETLSAKFYQVSPHSLGISALKVSASKSLLDSRRLHPGGILATACM